MKTIILLLTSLAAMGQIARPTYNPFNNGTMPFYGGNRFVMPNQGFQFPNNTNHPLNFHRPNNFGFQNNFYRPQQQYSPQNNWQRPQQQYRPQQNNWQQPQIQPYQPSVPQQPSITPQPQNPQPQNPQPPQTNNPTLFTRKFYLNNGYLYGRPNLYIDPKTGKAQPWVRKNLR